MTLPAAAAFLARARHEAERYGADPWVLVRELLQNARDAGASAVWLTAGSAGGRERFSCRDDGCGMSFEHARRYLLTLYASSKSGGRRTAGRFGIGFWSVLRFRPELVTIRSRPARGAGWELRLDASLAVLGVEPAVLDRGTEVVLERAAVGEDLPAAVRAAVRADAPFLSRRGRGHRPLVVRVNGDPVRAELELPPPSLDFTRPGLRGAVGLAAVARVELFAHGLRVRDAASLDELLLAGARGRAPMPLATAGLTPRVVLDSRRLSPLLARSDAQEDAALRRLVAVGHRELRRLLRAVLRRHAGGGLRARLGDGLRERWAATPGLRWAVPAAAVGLATVIATGGDRLHQRVLELVREPAAASAADPGSGASAPAPYRDLAPRYRGPGGAGVAATAAAVDLSYRPAGARPWLAALSLDGLDADGRPLPRPPGPLRPYPGTPCTADCFELELAVDAGPGLLPLPLPTGHALDPRSLRRGGLPAEVLAAGDGRPLLRLEAAWTGRVVYRSGPAAATPAAGTASSWPPLPAAAVAWSEEVRGLAPAAAADAAARWVADRLVYDASPAAVGALEAARRRGLDLFAATLAAGAGDCDVQNALAAAMLEAAEVEARLAVGWLGADGRAVPVLHAWVEYLTEDGRWQVIDASALAAGGPGPPAAAAGAAGPATGGSRRTAAAAILAAVLAGAALLAVRGPRRRLRAGTAADAVELLRAAALRPEAFAGSTPLFARRAIRALGGRRVSLQRARSAARRGRLGVGSAGSALAARAAAGGGLVLDSDTAAGRAVAEALEAVDLERWQELLARARVEPPAAAVERALTEAGEACRLRVADAVGEEFALLVGAGLGLGRSERWLVVDAGAATWAAARRLAERRPAAAALLLAEAVVERIGVSPPRRARCLAGLASSAVAEAGGGGR